MPVAREHLETRCLKHAVPKSSQVSNKRVNRDRVGEPLLPDLLNAIIFEFSCVHIDTHLDRTLSMAYDIQSFPVPVHMYRYHILTIFARNLVHLYIIPVRSSSEELAPRRTSAAELEAPTLPRGPPQPQLHPGALIQLIHGPKQFDSNFWKANTRRHIESIDLSRRNGGERFDA